MKKKIKARIARTSPAKVLGLRSLSEEDWPINRVKGKAKHKSSTDCLTKSHSLTLQTATRRRPGKTRYVFG